VDAVRGRGFGRSDAVSIAQWAHRPAQLADKLVIAVTPSDIQRAAQRHLTRAPLVIVVAGDPKLIMPQLNRFGGDMVAVRFAGH
jgi:hypothetical protein